MSLASFQRALCDLIASPDLCLAVRADPESALADYRLSDREHRRLAAVVWQRGMSTSCTLYRSNRVTPIYTLLNCTCRSLGDQFPRVLERYWSETIYSDGQFLSEIERFARFLKARIAEGWIASPFTAELLDYELAVNALEFGPRSGVRREVGARTAHDPDAPCRLHPLARIVQFRHEPLVVLEMTSQGLMPSPDLPHQDAFVVISVLGGALTVLRLPDELTPIFTEDRYRLTPRLAPALADAGLLVPL